MYRYEYIDGDYCILPTIQEGRDTIISTEFQARTIVAALNLVETINQPCHHHVNPSVPRTGIEVYGFPCGCFITNTSPVGRGSSEEECPF